MKKYILYLCFFIGYNSIEAQVEHRFSIGSSANYTSVYGDGNKFKGFKNIFSNPFDYAEGLDIDGRAWALNYVSFIYSVNTERTRASVGFSYPNGGGLRNLFINYSPISIVKKDRIIIWPYIGFSYQFNLIGKNQSRYTGYDANLGFNVEVPLYKGIFTTLDTQYQYNLNVDQQNIRLYIGLGYRF